MQTMDGTTLGRRVAAAIEAATGAVIESLPPAIAGLPEQCEFHAASRYSGPDGRGEIGISASRSFAVEVRDRMREERAGALLTDRRSSSVLHELVRIIGAELAVALAGEDAIFEAPQSIDPAAAVRAHATAGPRAIEVALRATEGFALVLILPAQPA